MNGDAVEDSADKHFCKRFPTSLESLEVIEQFNTTTKPLRVNVDGKEYMMKRGGGHGLLNDEHLVQVVKASFCFPVPYQASRRSHVDFAKLIPNFCIQEFFANVCYAAMGVCVPSMALYHVSVEANVECGDTHGKRRPAIPSVLPSYVLLVEYIPEKVRGLFLYFLFLLGNSGEEASSPGQFALHFERYLPESGREQ